MTERQILLHYRAATRLDRQRRAALAVDVCAAFAGGKTAERHLARLDAADSE